MCDQVVLKINRRERRKNKTRHYVGWMFQNSSVASASCGNPNTQLWSIWSRHLSFFKPM